jgi:hypothetical protein
MRRIFAYAIFQQTEGLRVPQAVFPFCRKRHRPVLNELVPKPYWFFHKLCCFSPYGVRNSVFKRLLFQN